MGAFCRRGGAYAVEICVGKGGITRPCSKEARLLQELALSCQNEGFSGWLASWGPAVSVEWLELPSTFVSHSRLSWQEHINVSANLHPFNTIARPPAGRIWPRIAASAPAHPWNINQHLLQIVPRSWDCDTGLRSIAPLIISRCCRAPAPAKLAGMGSRVVTRQHAVLPATWVRKKLTLHSRRRINLFRSPACIGSCVDSALFASQRGMKPIYVCLPSTLAT